MRQISTRKMKEIISLYVGCKSLYSKFTKGMDRIEMYNKMMSNNSLFTKNLLNPRHRNPK